MQNNHDPEAGMHDDEFPDDHSHEAQDLGDGKHGVYVADDEGRHYYLEHTVTVEGVIIDVYDRYCDELLHTSSSTWDEIYTELVNSDTKLWATVRGKGN